MRGERASPLDGGGSCGSQCVQDTGLIYGTCMWFKQQLNCEFYLCTDTMIVVGLAFSGIYDLRSFVSLPITDGSLHEVCLPCYYALPSLVDILSLATRSILRSRVSGSTHAQISL